MLCTVLHLCGMSAPYRPTHVHHPCTKWAGESLGNWKWLRRLVRKLNVEYGYRFGRDRDHGSAIVAGGLALPPLPDRGLTEFAQAMPERYRVPGDAVTAYRRFYVAEKAAIASWTRRRRPRWFVEGLEAVGLAPDRPRETVGR